MSVVDLIATAAGLPQAWSSRRLGRVGATCVKVLRMDELSVEEESHGTDEALIVLDGLLELDVNGTPVSVRAGELYMVAAGTAHTVRPGSHGALVIVESTEG